LLGQLQVFAHALLEFFLISTYFDTRFDHVLGVAPQTHSETATPFKKTGRVAFLG